MIGLIVYLADIYTYVPNILSVERKKTIPLSNESNME